MLALFILFACAAPKPLDSGALPFDSGEAADSGDGWVELTCEIEVAGQLAWACVCPAIAPELAPQALDGWMLLTPFDAPSAEGARWERAETESYDPVAQTYRLEGDGRHAVWDCMASVR